jgi:four helix bundle protein
MKDQTAIEKEQFIESLKKRTKKFAVDSILFCESMKKCKATDVVTYQFIKSSTSTGANYRAACRARSKAEFFSKLCIVVEELDESDFWLEIISEAKLSVNNEVLTKLKSEAIELLRILSSAKDTVYKIDNSR